MQFKENSNSSQDFLNGRELKAAVEAWICKKKLNFIEKIISKHIFPLKNDKILDSNTLPRDYNLEMFNHLNRLTLWFF